jgi:hypothetical protein
MSMVSGCATTRYGCCPDGKTSKVDNAGTNCPQGPEFDQILSGDVTITKLPKYKSIYKIEFSMKNISKVLVYQTWSSTSDNLNNNRIVTEIKATTWVKGAFRKVEKGTVPFNCNAIALFNPVICQDGKKYDNAGIALCAGQKACKPFSPTIPFQPTVVMELDNGQCPYHHKCKTCKKDADCKHVFVLIRALVNKNDQVVFYVSSKNIVLPSNPNQELKLLKEIPVGSFRRARFDIDFLWCNDIDYDNQWDDCYIVDQ